MAASVSKVAEAMRLTSLPHNIKWRIESTNAVTGEGIYEGLDWLSQNLPNKAE
jgi:ADP-ribosylation factor protein 1